MSTFPSLEEIQELREKYKKNPKRLKEIKNLIDKILDYNGDKLRITATAGLTNFDIEEPLGVSSALRDLELSKANLYRILEAELRRRGYYTNLSIHNEDTGEIFCDLMIGW